MKIIITGGAGFIGSAVVRKAISQGHSVVNVDMLTYASCLDNVAHFANDDRYKFEQVDIRNRSSLDEVFTKHKPDAVMHLAAESHVDRSIDGPENFVKTNIDGTFNMLEAFRYYWLSRGKPKSFRFHHISTDEVFGSLGSSGMFSEDTPYDPRSPYSASKASADHLVRAWHHTYAVPVIITNCSNNYGPYQFPEKLIPLIILNALEGKDLPIYGNGKQIRDWLYVDDHARALLQVAFYGEVGETYNIGGHNEIKNIDVVKTVCFILDELSPSKIDGIDKYEQLIVYVADRVGHDIRYAIDATKIANELSWTPDETFATGIRKTVEWYLENSIWCERVKDGTYQGERLGVIES